MSDHPEDQRPGRSGASSHAPDPVRELIESAGPRPDPPEIELAHIRAAARDAWRSNWGRQEPSTEEPRQRAPALIWALAAAALLLLVAGLGWWSSRLAEPLEIVASVERVEGEAFTIVRDGATPRALQAGDALPVGALVTTDGAAGGRVALADGSLSATSVRLDGDSRVRVMSSAVYQLEHGAIYVDTHEGRGGSVEIHTPFGIARDVGTQFEVRLLGDGDSPLRIRVREGAVRVSAGERTYRAEAGGELTLAAEGLVAEGPIEAWGEEWAWVVQAAPELAINRPVPEVIQWVAREKGWQVVYEGIDEASLPFVDAGEVKATAGEALQLALDAAELVYDLEDGVLTVRRDDS